MEGFIDFIFKKWHSKSNRRDPYLFRQIRLYLLDIYNEDHPSMTQELLDYIYSFKDGKNKYETGLKHDKD